MKHESCELFKMIPQERIRQVFESSETVGAECDHTFLGFEKVYKAVTLFVPKSKIIIDLGCAYAFQSWYFRDYAKYIGVDYDTKENDVLKTENSEFYFMSIQKFIKEYVWEDQYGFREIRLPGMGPKRLEDVFAICSYVVDEKAQRLVRETFPNCLVYYPN